MGGGLSYNVGMSKSGAGADPVFKLAKARVKKLFKQFEAEAGATASGSSSPVLSPVLIHQLRVCSKRLRALLQLYRPQLDKSKIRPLENAIKELADAYSGQRDALVQYDTLLHMLEQYRQSEDTDVQPLVHYLEARLQQQTEQPPAMDPQLALTDILQLWQDKLSRRKVPSFAEGMEFAYHKARKLAYQAEASDDEEVYHQCRKWSKYYLYQLQMLVEAPRPRDKAHIKQLKSLGELLGAFHDRCVLTTYLNELLAQHSADEALEQAALLVLSWLMEQKRADKTQCHALFEGVFARPQSPVKLKG